MKNLSVSVVALSLVFVTSATTASANHASYCYTGRCLHVDGEQHMIDALAAMDVLFAAPCVRTRGKASVAVQRELGRAIGDVKSVDARLLLIKSQGLVGRFVGTGDVFFLDSAAQLVAQAIAAEHLAHDRLHANDPFSSQRPPLGFGRELERPLGHHYGNNSSFRYQSNFRPGYGSGARSGSAFGGSGIGCNVPPASGFSIRIGR